MKKTKSLPKDITTHELMELDYRYSYSDSELYSDWSKLKNTTEYKNGAQFKPGLKLCQHFFPNFWEIENSKGVSFASAWRDFDVMDRVRRWGLDGMSQLWLSWIRRAVFMTAGLPNSSMYRPHFSRQIIQGTGKQSGLLFDPCAGWGGRMLGTVSCGWKYVSCEPNKVTYDHLCELVEFLEIEDFVELHNIPVEDFDIKTLGPVDIVLTSPPYFNLEVYTSGPGQSYNKYPTYAEWSDRWLKPLIQNCLDVLVDDGISAWNVMNFKNATLVEDVVSVHKEFGWELTGTVGFDSPLRNIRTLKNKDVTYMFKKNEK